MRLVGSVFHSKADLSTPFLLGIFPHGVLDRVAQILPPKWYESNAPIYQLIGGREGLQNAISKFWYPKFDLWKIESSPTRLSFR